MPKESLIVDGEVGFCHLTETDKLPDGKDTERFTITLNLDEETKDLLTSKGVIVRGIEDGRPLRKFATKISMQDVIKEWKDGELVPAEPERWLVRDENDERFEGELEFPWKARVEVDLGLPHPQWGVTTYLKQVKILERIEKQSSSSYANL